MEYPWSSRKAWRKKEVLFFEAPGNIRNHSELFTCQLSCINLWTNFWVHIIITILQWGKWVFEWSSNFITLCEKELEIRLKRHRSVVATIGLFIHLFCQHIFWASLPVSILNWSIERHQSSLHQALSVTESLLWGRMPGRFLKGKVTFELHVRNSAEQKAGGGTD